jgi:hypothetical protein
MRRLGACKRAGRWALRCRGVHHNIGEHEQPCAHNSKRVYARDGLYRFVTVVAVEGTPRVLRGYSKRD